MRALIEGIFLSADLEPWAFTDRETQQEKSGESWSINVLGDDDQTVRLGAKADQFAKEDFPPRNSEVVVTVDFFPTKDERGRSAFRAPKALAIRTGKAIEDATPAKPKGGSTP